MITPEFPSINKIGGIANYVYNLSINLQHRGHDITVLTRGSLNKTTLKLIDGIKVFCITMPKLYPFHVNIHGFFMRSLFRSIESNFDLVHLHSPIIPHIKTKLPVISTVHTLYKVDTAYSMNVDKNITSLLDRLQSIVLYGIELKTLNNSALLTTVSDSVAKNLINYGVNNKDIKILGNGVDDSYYRPIETEKSYAYILYVGRIALRKGLDTLLNCAKIVVEKYPSIIFNVVGTGPLLDTMIRKAYSMGLQNNVSFLGYVSKEKLQKLYKNATIQILPSDYEGLPTVLLEAMSSGLPVIATAVGGNPEVISSGINGFLVEPRDYQGISASIFELLENRTLRDKIKKSARKTIEENYTWNIITEKYLKYYEEIL